MKKIFSIFIVCFITSTVYSQKEITIEDAGKHVGDSVKICAKVYGGIYLERSNGTPTFLNLGGSYPNNPLTIVIWPYVRKEFKDKPEEYYKDKEVCVTGKIELFRDKPQIVLRSKDLLLLKE